MLRGEVEHVPRRVTEMAELIHLSGVKGLLRQLDDEEPLDGIAKPIACRDRGRGWRRAVMGASHQDNEQGRCERPCEESKQESTAGVCPAPPMA